jgi:hypothetical protein
MNILFGDGLIKVTHHTRKEKELNFGCVYPQLIIVTCLHSSRILRTFSLAMSCKIVVPSSSVHKENVKTPNENSQSWFHIPIHKIGGVGEGDEGGEGRISFVGGGGALLALQVCMSPSWLAKKILFKFGVN